MSMAAGLDGVPAAAVHNLPELLFGLLRELRASKGVTPLELRELEEVRVRDLAVDACGLGEAARSDKRVPLPELATGPVPGVRGHLRRAREGAHGLRVAPEGLERKAASLKRMKRLRMRGIGLEELVIRLQGIFSRVVHQAHVAKLQQCVARARIVGMRAHERADARRT